MAAPHKARHAAHGRREGLRMWCRPGGRWLQAVEGGEREEKRETREKTDDKGGPTAGVHVSKTSHENHPMVKTGGFESQMVKYFWFFDLMVKTKLRQELDGQK